MPGFTLDHPLPPIVICVTQEQNCYRESRKVHLAHNMQYQVQYFGQERSLLGV
jgi:hypothetical protein